jgi:uncharacterized protein (DUF885 family)
LTFSAALVAASGPSRLDAADAPTELKNILDEAWEFQLREEPLFATRVGDKRYNDRLPSVSPADFERRAAFARQMLSRLAALDRGALSPVDRVNCDMFERTVADDLKELDFKTWRMPLNAEGSFHSGFARLPVTVPFSSTRDYDNYLARLRAFPAYGRQQTENMREGLRTGFVQPKVILQGFEDTITVHIVSDLEKSVFWKPFVNFPTGVPEADRARLRQAGREAIEKDVLPVYRALLDFVTKEYVPKARPTIAARDLPQGPEYYAYCVKHFTTLDLTPDQVHELGLKEVARIRAEMDEVLKQVKWEKGFPQFLEFLRTDPRFYPKTAVSC